MLKALMLFLVSTLFFPVLSHARDTISDYDIQEAMNLAESKSKLGNEIKFYFGKQSHPAISESFGEFRTNKKTNAFNKTDKKACQRVFLSAMISLRNRAFREGGDAVINIRSNYRSNLTTSETTFKCGAGAVIAGVALVGEVVKLQD